ncbi:MAG: hypothetical protein LBT09_10705 [Planctomycetaceae bacterium]|jgi:endonuclease-3 related protein|nr:hypothetical protein [Planctomycetaceae bacterium]
MSVIRKIYELLCEHYEVQPVVRGWFIDPVAVVIGLVLVQGTTWRVVVKILELLRSRSLLSFRGIVEADEELLSDLICSAGFQVKKVHRLKEISRLFLSYGDGNVLPFFARDVDEVRRELLRVRGLSPGVVDNIILYAGKLPIYVVDLYTSRIFRRHEIVPDSAGDADIQQFIHFDLVPDEEPHGAELFSAFQALMVKIGRTYCGVPVPDCSQCPLSELLPAAGAKNINIKEEPTIQIIPLILANKLRLKPNRPKIHNVKPERSQEIISVTKKQKKQKTEKIETTEKNFHTAQVPQEKVKLTQNKIADKELNLTELNLTDIEKRILGSVDLGPVQIDWIVQETTLPVHVVRATIAMLEMKKILRQVEGNRVERNPEFGIC